MGEVKDWQYKDSNGNWIDCTKTQAAARKRKGQEIRKKPVVTPTPPPNQTSPTGYSDCEPGPYKKGCKGTPIATVQQCLLDRGYALKHGADGKFGRHTEKALINATNKKEFTKDEITTICQKMKPEESLSAPFGKEEQKAYWEDLKKNGLITSKGFIYPLKNSETYVYIIKYMKDGTKVPITREDLTDTTKLIQSFDEFDYVVLYPINPAAKATAGKVRVLTAGFNQNGEVEIQFAEDNNGNWKPAESEESFELSGEEPLTESVIKSILKLRLFEQNVTRTIGSSSSPSKSSSVRGGTSGSVSASLTSSSTPTVQKTEKDKKNEVKTVMDPKRIELLSTIDKLIQYTGKNGGMGKGLKIDEFKKNRELINNMDSSDVCSEESQKSLKSAIKDLDNSMSKYDLSLDNNEEAYLKKIRSILVSIPSECGKINEKYKTTTPSTLTPPSSNNASAIDKGSEALNTKTKEDETTKKVESGVGVDPEVKSFLESNGYTFDKPGIEEKERLSTKTTVGQQLRNLDGDGIYAEYYSDETPIWKSSEDPLNKDVVSDEGFKQLIKNINSEIPVESKRPFCRSSIKLLYQSAFPSTRVVQLKKRSVIENDVRLNQLKSAIIRCDEEKNFFEGAGGMRDELTALYRCRSNKKGKSYYGVDRYCLTDYKKLKQDNPTMQRESIVKKHMVEAIKNKQKDVMVESILTDIKRLKK